ncbi:DASH family cryptochrome [Flavobacterium sp. RNTU_13]|uniref:DASH family cryptochrome n=1 Tax=Flavobacterium sp. RNTU_13 TaxID=3375145 RepID=UPI0039888B96
MTAAIVWFKTDLRLHDNEVLVRAIQQSQAVVPVYCFDPEHYTTTRFGFKKTGAYRFSFLLQSLTALDTALRKLGSGLVIVTGKPEEELPKLAREYNARKLFAKKEVTFEERRTDERVTEALWKTGCEMMRYSTSTLYHAEDLPFTVKNIPDIFTNFRKKTEKDAVIRPVFDMPEKITSPALPPLQLPGHEQFGLQEAHPDTRAAIQFTGGEDEALRRMDEYLFKTHAIATYKETRNGLVGENYSSKFSPWLAMGCLSPREIYHEVKRYEQQYGENKSTYWLIFELLWRDYFRFMMKKHGNKLFLKGGFRDAAPKYPPHNPDALQAWIDGNTGQDFIDANMRELKLTGFMSNRGRQNVASYLCHDLGVDWRYGAAYFEEQLIDYDPASNWGNWAYVAGVGNDPREDRRFNPQKQAADYDPKKTYRNLWLHEV